MHAQDLEAVHTCTPEVRIPSVELRVSRCIVGSVGPSDLLSRCSPMLRGQHVQRIKQSALLPPCTCMPEVRRPSLQLGVSRCAVGLSGCQAIPCAHACPRSGACAHMHARGPDTLS